MYEDDNISIETCWVIDGNISVKLVGWSSILLKQIK
jgi:hypothetical protein